MGNASSILVLLILISFSYLLLLTLSSVVKKAQVWRLFYFYPITTSFNFPFVIFLRYQTGKTYSLRVLLLRNYSWLENHYFSLFSMVLIPFFLLKIYLWSLF